MAVDSTGKEQWSRCYALPDTVLLRTDFAAQTTTGTTILGGIAGSTRAWILALRDDGEVAWTWQSQDAPDTWAWDATQTADGGCVVVGMKGGMGWAVRFDSAGNAVWDKLYPTAPWLFERVVTSQHGGFLVAGGSTQDTAIQMPYRAAFLKLDEQGNEQHQQRFAASIAHVFATGLAPTSEGFLYAGYRTVERRYGGDAFLMQLDAQGDSVGSLDLPFEHGSSFSQLIITENSSIVIAGNLGYGDADSGTALGAMMDSGGKVMWSVLPDVPSPNTLNAVLALPDGDFLFGGTCGVQREE